MGMTRDEALKVWLPVIQMGVETMPECKEALDMAIDAMRKYQKIKEIVSNNELEWGNASVRANALLEVKKVVEDGNDNN